MTTPTNNITIKVILDLILLCIVGIPILVFAFGVTPFHRGFYCNDESIAHPYKDSTISTVVLSVVGIGLPFITMVLIELVIFKQNVGSYQRAQRSSIKFIFYKWDVHPYFVESYISIGAFLLGAAICQSTTDLTKYTLGRLRPHFLDVCKPDWSRVNCTDQQGFMRYVEEDVCTGDEDLIKEARLSHPSGHASLAMYCMLYLAIYLQSKLTWKGSKLLRHFLQFILMYMAIYTGLSRISDYKHHWSDVLGGAVLGALVAIIVVIFVSDLFKTATLAKMAKKIKILYDESHEHDSINRPYSQTSNVGVNSV